MSYTKVGRKLDPEAIREEIGELLSMAMSGWVAEHKKLWPIKAYDAAKRGMIEPKDWEALTILGFFIEQWEAYYGHAMKKNGGALKVDYDVIYDLYTHHGAELLVKALRVYFSAEMAWVTNKTLDFLTNDALWDRHVVIAIHAADRREQSSGGEQSEFAKKDASDGYRKV